MKRLKKLRLDQGLSQYQASEGIGISRSSLKNYEIGHRRPDFVTLTMIAQFYGVTVDYLIGADIFTPVEYSANRTILSRILEHMTEDEVGTLVRIARAIWFPDGDYEREWTHE